MKLIVQYDGVPMKRIVHVYQNTSVRDILRQMRENRMSVQYRGRTLNLDATVGEGGLRSGSKLFLHRSSDVARPEGKRCRRFHVHKNKSDKQTMKNAKPDNHTQCGVNQYHEGADNGYNLEEVNVHSNSNMVVTANGDDIGYTGDNGVIDSKHENVTIYRPVSLEWRRRFCRRFEIEIDFANLEEASVSQTTFEQAGPPMVIRRVLGDGNCFFRCIARLVTGKQKYYAMFRSLITEFIYSHVRGFGKVFDVKAHMTDSQMHENRTWATECEIFAAATLLQTTINVYTRHGIYAEEWVPYEPCFKLRTLSRSEEEIYLSNFYNCHFNIVEDVYPYEE